MADRYLKHKPSGVVYVYQAAYADRDDFEECADIHGNPLTPAIEGEATVVEDTPRKQTRAKKAAAGDGADQVKPEAPVLDDLDAALAADASRGL